MAKDMPKVIKIVFIDAPYLISPANPPKAIDNKPAAINSIGVPLIKAGMGAILILCRMPDIKVMDSKNPAAEPTAYTMD